MILNKAREHLVKMYVDALKEEVLPWRRPWDNDYRIHHHNPISNVQYHGTNNVLLSAVAASKGYRDPRWLTFKQIKDQGWSLENAKGQGVPVEFWSVYNKVTKKSVSLSEYNAAISNDPNCKKDFSIMDRTYYVFNAALVKGIPEFKLEEQPKKIKDASPFIENLIKKMGVDYVEDGNRAYYQPQIDKVTVPKSHQFHSQYSYDSTRLHELCHATGHSSRLNRNIVNLFGTQEYAKEELRAEISASFLAQDITINPSQRALDNHKAYIQNWIAILEENPDELFRAIKDAEKISGYVLEKGEYEKYQQLQNDQRLQIKTDKLFKMKAEDYPLSLQTILQERDAYILHKLEVPICVRCGYLDKNMNYLTNQEFERMTYNMEIDECTKYIKDNEIEDAGHRIVDDNDFSILSDNYAHSFIDPQFISFDKMPEFLNTFNYLTNTIYHAFDEEMCNRMQAEMMANRPITYEKMMTLRDRYLTDEVIDRMANKKDWIDAGANDGKEPASFIRSQLGINHTDKDDIKEIRTKSKPYYPIDEAAARRAKSVNSFSDYVEGSATAEYNATISEATEIAELQKKRVDPMYHEKIDQLLDTYARKVAENINKCNEIAARVPSIMITGGSNFPVRKKEKQIAAMDRNMKEYQSIQEILTKIRSTGMGGISADDPQAVQKLRNNLEGLEKSQETMKTVNAYYRKYKTIDGCPALSQEQTKELKADMSSQWHLGDKPFASYALSNNSAAIRRLKNRIQDLSQKTIKVDAGWEFPGGRVESNTEANRLQIFFDNKPDEVTRAKLKSSGFHWSPKVGVWQRQLTSNAIYAAKNMEILKVIEAPNYQNHKTKSLEDRVSNAKKKSVSVLDDYKLKKHENER